MKSPICDMLDIEFPLLAFSHCRDVVAEVSKAGGLGVFGAAFLKPDRLDEELRWIDNHVDGKPYGVDLIIPKKFEGKGEKNISVEQVAQNLPQSHKDYATRILDSYDIDSSDIYQTHNIQFNDNMRDEGAEAILDVAFSYPIRLIANALGVPPPFMLERGKAEGVAVAALVGAKEHALSQVAAGVDILVVAGGEAGGHCGEVSTMVLVPEIHQAVRSISDIPILAAGWYCDRCANGSSDGDGCCGCLDGFGLAHHCRSGS